MQIKESTNNKEEDPPQKKLMKIILNLFHIQK